MCTISPENFVHVGEGGTHWLDGGQNENRKNTEIESFRSYHGRAVHNQKGSSIAFKIFIPSRS